MTTSKSLIAGLLFVSLLATNLAIAKSNRREIEPAEQARIDAWIDRELPELLETYRHLHAHPELSHEEEKTAALVAKFLRQAGYSVETGIGGHGVVGVLRNGEGPTLLIRGDMDGLPVIEATGLPFTG